MFCSQPSANPKGRDQKPEYFPESAQSLGLSFKMGARKNAALLLKFESAVAQLSTERNIEHYLCPSFVSGQRIFTPGMQQIVVSVFLFYLQGKGGELCWGKLQFCFGLWMSSHLHTLIFCCLARPQKTVKIKKDQREMLFPGHSQISGRQ